jgi:hypothetical protein
VARSEIRKVKRNNQKFISNRTTLIYLPENNGVALNNYTRTMYKNENCPMKKVITSGK